MKAAHSRSSPALFEGGDSDPNTRAEQAWQILLPLIAVAGLIALWLATAPLGGTVVASSQVRVDLNRRIAQHQEEAFAREILVRDGDWMRTGQPLVPIESRRAFRLAISDWLKAVGQPVGMSCK